MFDNLLNKTVLGIEVSEGEQYLRFRFQDGDDVVFSTGADCCSETWFAEILAPYALIGEKILKAETLDIPHKDDNNSRQECDIFYGFALHSAKGICTVVFRNSSNGYYGGDIAELDPNTYAHWDGQAMKWQPVGENEWTAYGNKD